MPAGLQKHISTPLTVLLLLTALTWPAPLPVGHCHSDGGLDWSEQQMMLHLQTCHGGFGNVCNWPTGWHWHWVMQLESGLGGNDAVSRIQCEPLVERTNRDVCCHPLKEPLDTWLGEDPSISPSVPMHRRHSFTTIGLLASRHSLPELLGVIRC